MIRLDPLTLVFGADERFAMPLAVTLASCLRALPAAEPLEIYVIDGGISPQAQKRLHRVVNGQQLAVTRRLHVVRPQRQHLPRMEGYRFANSNFNVNNLLRLTMGQLLPETCHRAIYLDSDLIVCANLREFDREIGDDVPVVAVRDFGIGSLSRRFGEHSVEALDGADLSRCYFNSGVLGINLDLWRREHIGERAVELTEKHESLRRFPDQDPLNVALYGRWREVDLAWNLQTGGPDRIRRVGGSEVEFLGEPYEEIRKRAKIIHFTGNKPWDQGFTNPDRPAFVEALRASGWFSPLEFRLWQAKWWGKLAQRTAPKVLASARGAVAHGITAARGEARR